jgi:branched-chain amino acid aminotransferase
MTREDMQKLKLYLNGDIVSMQEAKVSLFDWGLQEGYGVFDMARTFNGRPFKLREHLERLYHSLRYTRIDPGLSIEEIEEISLRVLRLNEELRGEHDDYWIGQVITKGADWPYSEDTPTVAVYNLPLPLGKWAKMYESGAHGVITSIRRTPPECVDPKVKVLSRINLELAQAEAGRVETGAYAILQDLGGNITEGPGLNIFVVKDGRLISPTAHSILRGVTRQTVMELAEKLGIPVYEANMQPYDVYAADEVFFTTTSRCILPVTVVDGLAIGSGMPGPMTKRLLKAWGDMVGVDIPGQARSHLNRVNR